MRWEVILSKIFVIVIGAIIGSFLNVCIYRMPRNESIVSPSSHCPKCNGKIKWYDNIPVVSFIILAGKCRRCKTKISLRYPIVEIITAMLLLGLFNVFAFTPKFFVYSIMTCALIAAAFIDLETEEIPDEISIGALGAGLALGVLFPSVLGAPDRLHALIGSCIGAAVGGGSILVLKTIGTFVFRKKIEELGIDGAMGDGDIKLMAMMGAFLGWKLILLTFFIAPFLGSVPGIITKIRKGAETIPYGPFLSMAALVSIFFGDKILSLFLLRPY